MEMTGRITADAVTKTVNGDKEVVNFTIAINDRYKKKGSDEYTEITTYVRCDYWLNPKIGQYLKKGTLVQLNGRIGQEVYINASGDAAGNITFNISKISILASAPKQEATAPAPQLATGKGKKGAGQENDDLPF